MSTIPLRLAVVALLLLAAGSASANGRYPAANALVFSPTDANLVVLRTTFGILISHDSGTTWTWLCEDALGLSPAASADPSLGLTASNALIAGTYLGLNISSDTGCSWGFASGLKDQQVVDVAARSASPHGAVALVSTYSSTAGPDSSAGFSTQLYETTDDGAMWSPLGGPFDPTVSVTTVDVAASDPNRLYVTGFRSSALFTPLLFVSLNHGASWSEHAMPVLSHDVGAYIAAVDPGNADLVYVRTAGAPNAGGRSRLFVTPDQGQSVQTALSLPGSMLGFALSPDGSKVYAGIEKGGLFVADRDALLAAADAGAGSDGGADAGDLVAVGDAGGAASPAFRQTSGIHVRCLATHGAELWACSDEVSGFIAGVSADDGASFLPKLHLHGIAGPIACAADAAAAQCSAAPWQQLCGTLVGCDDGGATDGGTGGTGGDAAGEDGAADAAGAGVQDASSSDAGDNTPLHGPSCGCSNVGAGGVAGLGATIVALATGAAVRLRRRRRENSVLRAPDEN